MTLNEVYERIPIWYDTGLAYQLESMPGRGKTTTVERAPALLSKLLGKNIGFVYINAGLCTPMHFMGFGVPRHFDASETSKAHSLMAFTRPFFWITREGKFLEEYDGGIIFIDEYDKAPVDVKPMLGELANSGQSGPHILPNGWVVWLASNRVEDKSGSTREPYHAANRKTLIPVTDDVQSLLDWCDDNDVSPFTKVFIKENPQVVFLEKVPDKPGPYCTPRSLIAADKHLRSVMKFTKRLDDGLTMTEVAGRIGMEAASQYFVMIKLNMEMPSYEEIIANPKTVKCPSKPDAQMLVCYTLASRVTAQDAAAVLTYIERMPKDFAATFARAAVKRDYKLVMAPAFNKWAMANAQLMNIINKV